MKKKKNFLKIAGLSCLMIPGMFLMTACGGDKTPKHEHNFAQEWSYNTTENHKRSCECGHEETANHNFTFESYDGSQHKKTCSDCGHWAYELHRFGNWAPDATNNELHARTCLDCGYIEKADHNRETSLDACSVCAHEFQVEGASSYVSTPLADLYQSDHFDAHGGDVKVFSFTTSSQTKVNRSLLIFLQETVESDAIDINDYTMELYDANKNLITNNLIAGNVQNEYWSFTAAEKNTTYYIVLKFEASKIANWTNANINTNNNVRLYIEDVERVNTSFSQNSTHPTKMTHDVFKYVATGVPTGSVLIVKPYAGANIMAESDLEIKKMNANGELVDATYTFNAGSDFELTIEENGVYYFRIKEKANGVDYRMVADFEFDMQITTAAKDNESATYQYSVAPNDCIRYFYQTNVTSTSKLEIKIEDTHGDPISEGISVRIYRVVGSMTLLDKTASFAQSGNVFTYTGNYSDSADIRGGSLLIDITFEGYEEVIVKVAQ